MLKLSLPFLSFSLNSGSQKVLGFAGGQPLAPLRSAGSFEGGAWPSALVKGEGTRCFFFAGGVFFICCFCDVFFVGLVWFVGFLMFFVMISLSFIF